MWLYKIGKKEVAASKILDAIGADHVPYMDVSNELRQKAEEEQIRKIYETNEKLVKCPIITSEQRSIVTWYDYVEHCSDEGGNPYTQIRQNPKYYEMQVCDYLLNNSDRHGENWGFFVDADTEKLGDLHPLFDHDHAFSEDARIVAQTTEHNMPLKRAAIQSLPYAKRLNLNAIRTMQRPEELTEEKWMGVQQRAKILIRERVRQREEKR